MPKREFSRSATTIRSIIGVTSASNAATTGFGGETESMLPSSLVVRLPLLLCESDIERISSYLEDKSRNSSADEYVSVCARSATMDWLMYVSSASRDVCPRVEP